MDIIHNMDYCEDILEFIERQPTIEPERKTGRWINLPQKESFVRWEHYKCSVCGNEFAMIDTPEPGGVYYFCPICGADMRGEQDG